jgi:hypothetical protein
MLGSRRAELAPLFTREAHRQLVAGRIRLYAAVVYHHRQH